MLNITPSVSGNINFLSIISQGVDYTQRIGDSIKIQRMEFNFRYTIGLGTKSTVRLMVVRDLDCQGVIPNVTDILEIADVLSPKKYLNTERFSILVDEIQALSTTGTPNSVSEFNLSHEGHIKYLNNGASATSAGKGTIFLLTISNETITNAPSVNAYARIYYTDD